MRGEVWRQKLRVIFFISLNRTKYENCSVEKKYDYCFNGNARIMKLKCGNEVLYFENRLFSLINMVKANLYFRKYDDGMTKWTRADSFGLNLSDFDRKNF